MKWWSDVVYAGKSISVPARMPPAQARECAERLETWGRTETTTAPDAYWRLVRRNYDGTVTVTGSDIRGDRD